MKINKKIIIITLILTIFLSLTTVNAENITDNINTTDSTIHNNTINQTIIQMDYPTGTIYVDSSQATNGDGSQSNPYKDIKTAINSASTSGTIVLKEGIYTGENNTGIIISKYDLKIYGENATIDFKDTNTPFILNNQITISNINFINSENSTLIINSNLVNIENCKFINNTAETGGAIYWKGNYGNLHNSTFINNIAELEGGAIQLDAASNNNITENTFIDNTGDYGGAICIANSASNNIIEYNAFINNTDYFGCDVNINTNSNPSNSINNNWWGDNNPDFAYVKRYITDMAPETWIIMNFTSNDFTSTGGINTLTASLNTIYNKTSKTFTEFTNNFLNRTIIFNANTGSLNPTITSFINTINTTYTYPATENIIVTATIDNQTLTLTNKNNQDTFKDLAKIISESTGEINLTKNYTFDINYDLQYLEGIIIDKTLTINGNGNTINADNIARIFNITANNVKLNNLNLINAYNDLNGGSIIWTGTSGIINNTIISNSTAFKGAGLYSTGNYLTIINTTFNNNQADENGGAIYFTGNYANISNSQFRENYAKYYGGAIYAEGKNSNIINSTFTNNTGDICGGALHLFDYTNGIVESNLFLENTAGTGGAICLAGTPTNINITSNVIVNNNDWYNTGVGTFAGSWSNINLNDNWWGENNPAFLYFKEFLPELTPETWVILNFTKNQDFTTTGGIINLTASFTNSYNNTSKKYQDFTGYLPNRTVTFDANLGSLNPNTKTLNQKAETEYTYPSGTNDLIVTANVDNQIVYLTNFEPNDTYTILQSLIDATPEGGELNLSQNYTYSPIFDTIYTNGMFITKTITINGNNHVLNSNGQSSVFQVSADNVILNNITFTNGLSTDYGGAIYWIGLNGIINNSQFNNNTASSGGAIFSESENGQITNTIFTNNTADNGGAVTITGTNSIINNTIFNNNAASNAGALSWDWASDGLLLNSRFTNNYASGSGGAVSWSGINGEIRNTTFINNSAEINGGAVEWSAMKDGLVNNSTFMNNSAGENGGGISWGLFRGNGTVQNSIFEDNQASKGGAYYWGLKGNGTIINTTFTNNNATEGGAALFYYANDSRVINSTFIENRATIDGGAIQAVVSNNFLAYNNTFINNNATKDGGAILYGSTEKMTTYTINNTFIENHALGGGAIYAFTITGIIENNTFTGNNAPDYGGAIYLESGVEYNLTNNNYTKNKASRGGAIYLTSSDYTVLINNSNFNENNASGYGGAIMTFNSKTTITNSNFTNNTASRGGAVGCAGDYNNITNSQFQDNYATVNGGAIFWNNNAGTLANSKFINNSADNLGGGIYWAGSYGQINNTEFIENNASHGGALLLNGEYFELNNDTFIKNNVTGYGGAIYQAKDNTKITNSIFTENTAQNGLIYSLGTLNITKTNITNNTATYGVILLATKKTQILNSILKNNSAFYLIENKNDLNITGSVILNYNADYEIYNEGTASAEYNWWGNNTPYLTYINDNLIVNNWIILNGSLNGNIVTATLNTTQNGDPLPSYVELPSTLIIFNSTTGTLNPEINSTNTQMITNTLYSQNTGNNANISISLDNETIYLTGIVKFNTYLYFFNETFILNDTYYLKIRLSNETDGLKNKTVYIQYNNTVYNFTTDENGEINLSSNTWNILENLNLGENIFYCYFLEDDTYYNSTVYGNLIIMEKTFINSTNINASENSDFNLTISLKNQLGNPIPNQIITLTINNTQFNITTDTNGIATFTYNATIRNYLNLTEGTYTFNYTYKGNTTLYYLESTNNNTIKINSIIKNTTITGGNLNLTTKDIGIFTIKLTDNESNPLPLMTVTVNFNNQTNYYITNNNGEINIYIFNITPGEYNITYTFNGTNKYQPSNGSNIINITQATKNTKISATNIITDNGTDSNFTITLTDEDNNPLPLMTITVNFNTTTTNYTTDSNGQVKINLKNLTPGTYIINYTFQGNTNYTNSNNSNIIIINEKITKQNTTINAVNITINNNTAYNYIITLYNENGNTLPGENITINFNNNIYYKFTDSNGEINILLSNLPVGIYNITYNYTGSKYYNPSYGKNTINITEYIPPKTTSISASDITIEQGEDKTFAILLVDIDGVKLSYQNVTVNFNGTTNNYVTDVNGEISFNLSILSIGNYTVKYNFNGTSDYYSSFGFNTVEVLEKTLNTSLIGASYVLTYADYNYNIQLVDELGNNLSNQDILITFNGAFYNLTTDSNGEVNVLLFNLTSGFYVINYTFLGKDNYLASNDYGIIEVYKILKNTTIETNLTINTLTLKLKDIESNILALKIVEITINNSTSYYATDNNGEISIDLKPGEYNITYSFNGTEDYYPVNGSLNFNITLIETLITGNDLTLYSNENATFTIQLTDTDGNPLKNQTVEISFNNTIKNYTTNNLGQINIIISNLTPNNYTINYTFKETEEYKTSNGTNKITIIEYLENLNTTITASDLNILTNETTDFIITLKDSNGNALNNQNITIQFNNTIITKTTNINGQVNITISNLTSGIYSISYGFAGSGRYQPSYSSNIIIVTQSTNILNTSITGNNITINENNLTYYTITLRDENNNPLSGKTIQINLNNQNYTKITDSNGKVSIILENLHAGTYNITYNFTGDSNYKKSSGISTINVTPYITPKTTSISASDVTMEQGENKELIIILTDINGIKLSYQNVIVNFNGTTNNYTTDINGEIKFNLSTLSIGNYTVKYNFNGTNEYYASFGTNNIIVNEKTLNTFLIAENINITTNTTYNYTIQLIDELGNKLTDKNVLVSFNGNNYSLTTDTNGKVNITLINLTSGTYIINYTFTKEGKYLASSNYSTITVSKIIKNTTIETNLTNTTFILKLTDNASNQLSLAIINITINNITNYYVTNGEGEVILADLSRGEYNISYSFDGTDEYLPTNGSTSFNITIPQTPTLINGTDITLYANENATFTIQLTDINGNPLKNQTIIVSFNNTINNYTTNNLGQVNILISNLTVNNYTINYIFIGNDECASSNGTNIITILEHLENLNITIYSSDLNILTNETIDFIITLKDENNNLLSNENITIQFNNISITKTTDINGQANITLSNLTAGVYTISYGFAGSGRYQPSYSSNIITVTQSATILNTKITGDNITINENNLTYYTIRLYDENNNPLIGKTIQINLNNQNYTKITDSNGEVSIILSNLTSGIYNITYNFTGDSNYKKSSGLSTINVTPYITPKTTSISASDITIEQGEDKSFIIILRDINGVKLPYQNVIVNFNGTTNNYATDINGEIKFNLSTLSIGNYTVKYNFNGTEEYYSSFGTNNITITEKTLNTFLIAENINITTNTTYNYVIQLIDELGNNLTSKNVLVSFNGNNYNLTTDTNGKVNITLINLTSGTYIITYTFQKEGKYLTSSNYSTITVSKIIKNTTIKTSIINTTFILKITDNASNPLSLAIVNITINNNTNYYVTNDNGEVILADLSRGEYNISYSFDGTDEYLPTNGSTSFNITIPQTPTLINGNDLTIYSNENATFTIQLTDINGNPLKNQTIIVSFNNTINNYTTNNLGQVNILISNLNPNNYTINYIFTGTGEYASSNGTNIITILEHLENLNTTISASDLNILTNETIDFIITLKDENNNLLANENITIQFNNTSIIKTTDINGQANITLSNLTAGIYGVSYGFSGSGRYQPSYSSNIITVTQSTNILNTTITGNNITINENNITDYIITLHDENNNPLTGKTIQINLNNQNYTKITDSNGEASIIIENLPIGIYNITYKFTGDSNYKKSSGISTINITPYNQPKTTSINGKDLNITNKDNATFTIRLITIDGKPINNVTININFNNALITKNTNNNGEANISLNNLNPGKYPIIYSFNGTEEYLPSFNHNTITVNEYINNISTIITGSDITITESDKIQYNISLKDENNNSLSNQNITVIFNSQTHNLTTDTQGYAYLNISNLNIGTYTINYYFQGYKQYQASQGYNTINVTKKPIIKLNTTINANNINLTDNETKEFNITLKDENNKTLKNEIIIVEFNNNTYTLATNNEGKTSLTISNLKPGTYNITYSFNGTNEYNPSKNNNTITVIPHTTPTATSINAKDINITNKDNTTFTIKLITIGGQPINNATININFNNTTTTKNTNPNGEVNISLNNLKPGTYNITYSFNGTNEYYPSFNYNTITVTKYEKTPTQLIAHNTTITNTTNTTYTIKLIDENNNTLSNQTITIEFNNNTYTLTTNNNGEVQIPLNNLNTGIYNITSTFQETEEYQASNTTNTINVIPKTILNTTINAPNINMTNTETQNLTITLQDQYQNPLNSEIITVEFNNNTYNLTTNNNGQTTFILDNLKPGTYNITYTYQETENYHTSTNTSNITVTNNTQKTLPQIYGYDTIEIINTTTYFTITLQDQYQNPIQNNTITFNIDNNTITSNTDNKGQATITLPNLEEGYYTITYTSQETPEYYQTNNTNRIYAINLNPTNDTNTTNDTNDTNTTNITINTTINTTNLIKYYQTPTPLKGTLTTTNQTPLTNQTITITITKLANKKTKTYTLTTDNNGEFTLPINLANGTYLATIKYNGTTINNTTYNHTTTHITITIKNPPTIHINTTINTTTYKEQYNTGHSFNGTLTTTNNNTPLPNQTITITLIKTTNNKTKTYNVTSDNNGEFNLPINLAPALYLVYCTYAGTEIYQPTTNYNTITVYGEL